MTFIDQCLPFGAAPELSNALPRFLESTGPGPLFGRTSIITLLRCKQPAVDLTRSPTRLYQGRNKSKHNTGVLNEG